MTPYILSICNAGQNGWTFFDYHLAMFGPQEVPLGPFRLQMALPPFGCDPGAYTVRIQGAVVAILRGGGCSFGIKVNDSQCSAALSGRPMQVVDIPYIASHSHR